MQTSHAISKILYYLFTLFIAARRASRFTPRYCDTLFYFVCFSTLRGCIYFLCVLTECILCFVVHLGHIFLKSSIVLCYNIHKLINLLT